MTSAYPPKLDKIIEQVRTLATELGEWPSARQIKPTFNVGHDKAKAALEYLKATGFNPATGTVEFTPVPATERRLHVVTTPVLPDAGDHQPDESPALDAPTAQDDTDVVPEGSPAAEPAGTVEPLVAPVDVTSPRDARVEDADVTSAPAKSGRWRNVPLYLIALGAFVAIWGGWVGLGELTGFGPVAPLPGIADNWTINTAITLPLGMEAYAAFAMRVWLDHTKTPLARRFAMWSTFAALVLGMSGQVAYHLMKAAGMTAAPWQITTFVSCLPVLVLGGAAALVHLSHNTSEVQR
ncbi:ABC transporter permease [Lentzea sp. CA-135723]|uniref:ABC transporter permease n=1 Tax=Lentzea sp. CA-135723 TaxID=3239950 RepID=UPI003D904E4C